MAGWHHRLIRREFEQTLGDGGRQGSLACCSPWGHKESGMTEQLNNNKNICTYIYIYVTIYIHLYLLLLHVYYPCVCVCVCVYIYLPNPGIEPVFCHLLHWQADSLPLSHLGSTKNLKFSGSVTSDSLQPHGCSTPGSPVFHHLPKFAQIHVH